jgi:hypothetical protein
MFINAIKSNWEIVVLNYVWRRLTHKTIRAGHHQNFKYNACPDYKNFHQPRFCEWNGKNYGKEVGNEIAGGDSGSANHEYSTTVTMTSL